MRVGIIGSGPSGLSVAARLLSERDTESRVRLKVFESLARPGGKVHTDHTNGYTIETGPEGFLDSAPRSLELVRGLDLESRLIRASGRARHRYLYDTGKLVKLPTGPLALLKSPLLTARGKLRLFTEPFRRPGTAEEESALAFATRRLGREAAQKLVGTMVTGVFAGDPARLSMQAAFPRLAGYEQQYGSLTRALIALKRSKASPGGPQGPGGRLCSFTNGLSELVERIAGALGPDLLLETPVTELERSGSEWIVVTPRGRESFDAVVMAAEPWHAAGILRPADSSLAAVLEEIEPTSLAVVALGFRSHDVPSRLDGFGFLAPRSQGLRLLGCTWSSSIFGNRAPEGSVLLRVMVGGALDPGIVELPYEKLVDTVLRELQQVLGISRHPELVRLYRHPRAIPQYTLGHLDRLRRIDRRLEQLPGLFLTGNGYRGASFNACVRNGFETAAAVTDYLHSTARSPAA